VLKSNLAASADDAGFCPVINSPSFFTNELQLSPLLYFAPSFCSSSSSKKGTIFVKPTASSSVSEKPVTSLSFTKGLPSLSLTFIKAAGAWHTNAIGF